MNKILTHEGGQPLYLDDVAFVDNAVRDSFSGILSMFGTGQNVYLTDLNIVKGEIAQGVQTVRWSAGYIALNGEILSVAAGNIAINPALPLYWHVVTSNGENSNRIFEDGIARDCLQVRRAVLSTAPEGGFLETNLKSVRNAMTSMLANDFRGRIAWRTLSVDSGYAGMASKLELGFDGQCYYLRGVYRTYSEIQLFKRPVSKNDYLLEQKGVVITEQESLGIANSSMNGGMTTFSTVFYCDDNLVADHQPWGFGLRFDVSHQRGELYIGDMWRVFNSAYEPKIPAGYSCTFFVTLT